MTDEKRNQPGVGCDGGEQRQGNLWGDLDVERFAQFQDEASGGFGGFFFELDRPQIVLSDVVVDDDALARKRTDDFGHRSELDPSTRVDDDQDVVLPKLFGLDRLAQDADVAVRIQEGDMLWYGIAIGNNDLFAERL